MFLVADRYEWVLQSACSATRGAPAGVGAALHVFADVIPGRAPVQELPGLLTTEALVHRKAHAAAAAARIHFHERHGLDSTVGAHESADRRGQVAKGNFVG